eukprot:193255-Pyramimonas_sp.AAC.3
MYIIPALAVRSLRTAGDKYWYWYWYSRQWTSAFTARTFACTHLGTVCTQKQANPARSSTTKSVNTEVLEIKRL